jgi:D-inositol-3-phosphate glycosyltransferase
LKILSIGPAYPLRGGIAKFNETLCGNLQKSGHKVVLYSYKFQYPSFLFPGKTQYSEENRKINLKIENELHSVNFFSWKKTVNRIKEENPDLIIIHYWMPFFAVQLNFILRRLQSFNVKILLLSHNLIPHEKQPGTVYLTKTLLNGIDGLVCLSDSVKNDALQLRQDIQCLVQNHPVYDIYGEKLKRTEALKYLNLDSEYRYILFFGLIRDYKGLDLLLRAISGLKRDDIKLIVAGEFYGKKDIYTEIIQKENIKDRIILTDSFIPDSEVKYYFSIADLVVQPYKTATQSGVTQIAYHFGNPMIVTRVGGLPEIVEDGKSGFVVDTNPPAITNAINDFYQRDLFESFSLNVKKRKDEFSWDKFTKNLIDFSANL